MKKLLFYSMTVMFSFSLWAQGGITTPSPGAGTSGGMGTMNTTPQATGTDNVIEQQEEESARRHGSQNRRRQTGNPPNGTGAQSGQETMTTPSTMPTAPTSPGTPSNTPTTTP